MPYDAEEEKRVSRLLDECFQTLRSIQEKATPEQWEEMLETEVNLQAR